uniref:TIL domain-containing protein n=1 Tax=Plectus sambesii TaxID=2011161 RepID=A0A914WPA8_9BILA
MNSACCVAVLLLLAASCSSMSINPCLLMKCANGACVNDGCTGNPNECGPNMHWEECGSSCSARCDLDPAAIACTAVCRIGCFCDAGFVLDKAGICIPQEKCPKQVDPSCALMLCAPGTICKNGKCIKKFIICPEYLLVAPPEGCNYVYENDESGCPVPKLVCPAVPSN